MDIVKFDMEKQKERHLMRDSKSATGGNKRKKAKKKRKSKSEWPVGVPRPVDIHVGQQVRLHRTLLGLTQQQVAQALNLTFQQIQKYERGGNRISASRLFEYSKLFDVPVSAFFEGIHEHSGEEFKTGEMAFSDHEQKPLEPNLFKRETIELIKAYNGIQDKTMRQLLLDMLKQAAISKVD